MSDAMPERWLPVVGAEGYYEVSDLGRVRSIPHRTQRGMRGGRILKPARLPKSGYLWVGISIHGVVKHKYVHVLVAEAFIGPCPEGQEVRHWDGNPGNCALSNLLYGTRSENHLDKRRHGTHHLANREACGQGHEWKPETTIIRYRPDGQFKQRVCATCLEGWRATAKLRARQRAAGDLVSD